jgi:uncharacterized membrane protein YhaH (DUF805 family)
MYIIGTIGTILTFLFVIPKAALVTRRLHDINCSGWWQILFWFRIILGVGYSRFGESHPLWLKIYKFFISIYGYGFFSNILITILMVLIIVPIFFSLFIGFRKSVESNKYTYLSCQSSKNMIELFKQYFWNVIRYHYFDFKGRATRKEYWMFVLFDFLCCLLGIFLSFLGLCIIGIIYDIYSIDDILLLIILSLPFIFYIIVIMPPRVALATKRLHDINYSGWWQLLAPVAISILYYFISYIIGFVICFIISLSGFDVDKADDSIFGLASLVALVLAPVIYFALIGLRKSVEPNKYTVYSAELLKNPKLPR